MSMAIIGDRSGRNEADCELAAVRYDRGHDLREPPPFGGPIPWSPNLLAPSVRLPGAFHDREAPFLNGTKPAPSLHSVRVLLLSRPCAVPSRQ